MASRERATRALHTQSQQPVLAMGSLLSRPEPHVVTHNDEEHGARELGLENNLKLTEVNTLIDYYKQNDPGNDGLLPDQFKEAAGQFMASELTIDPMVIFSIFDTGEGGVAGRVTLREFILGYAILCRGSTEGRLRYLFAIYGDADGSGFLTRAQLIRCLTLMQRIVSETTDQPDEHSHAENEKQINDVADQLIGDSDPEKKSISYHDFIQKLREDEVVTAWLEHLSSVAGDHLKYMEKRERDVVELHMEREGILTSDSAQGVVSVEKMDWESVQDYPSSQYGPSNASKKTTIPMPKKQKLVRRDLRRVERNETDKSTTSRQPEDDSTQEINAAKPFVINYEQIEFGKILGRGACATVYECEWMHVPVAVKVFNDGYGDAAGIEKLATNDEESRKAIVGDYVEEFWLLLQIRHPNCLLYMGICFEPYVCIVTELYSGGSVANFIHGPNPRKFTPETAISMLCGVARGMYYLHASSPPILHRDLKASNILINRTVTHCVICDFGLSSQFVSEASGLASREGNMHTGGIGTPYTMAPEVVQHKPYTPAADVYSFGIVMYEMYTGRFPFPKMKPIQLMFAVTEGKRPPFYDEDSVPPTLRKLIERCWSQKPDDRPTFEEILKVLTSRHLTVELAARQSASNSGDKGLEDSNETKFEELSRRLLEAVYRGQDELVARLIDEGAKVNYSDYDKRTALHVGTYNLAFFHLHHFQHPAFPP